MLKLGIVRIVGETIYFSYERLLNEESGLQFGLMAGNGRVVGNFSNRYYLSESPAPKGTFLAPIIGFGAADGPVFGAGLLFGPRGILKRKLLRKPILALYMGHQAQIRISHFLEELM